MIRKLKIYCNKEERSYLTKNHLDELAQTILKIKNLEKNYQRFIKPIAELYRITNFKPEMTEERKVEL